MHEVKTPPGNLIDPTTIHNRRIPGFACQSSEYNVPNMRLMEEVTVVGHFFQCFLEVTGFSGKKGHFYFIKMAPHGPHQNGILITPDISVSPVSRRCAVQHRSGIN